MHPIELKLKLLTEELKKSEANPLFIRNSLKEYLQDVILSIIYNDDELKELTFYGGSCLRKFHGLNRLSEDLDFETLEEISLDKTASIISDWFSREKFKKVDISTQSSKNINRILVKFPVLFELGLTNNDNEKLHVKVEVNTEPSGEYETLLTPYSSGRYSMLIKHYDLPTLMAGKMIACLERTFKKGETGVDIKGRDYYDLIWYMQKGIEPNLARLKDTSRGYTAAEAFEALDGKVADITKRDLLIDLEPLFSNQKFIEEWCENFHDFYSRFRMNY
jgi:predicted nucleotidyltransferase component of viral defense system